MIDLTSALVFTTTISILDHVLTACRHLEMTQAGSTMEAIYYTGLCGWAVLSGKWWKDRRVQKIEKKAKLIAQVVRDEMEKHKPNAEELAELREELKQIETVVIHNKA